jgi:hypothetical protein
MERRRWIDIGLLALAGLMLIGFFRSGARLTSPATIGALLVAVVLPATIAISRMRGVGAREQSRRDALRQQTIEAEVMKLAIQHKGKLTVLEVATALALQQDETKVAGDRKVERGIAHKEITQQGGIV